MSTIILDRWRMQRYNAFRWRYELGSVQKLALSAGIAVLTGLLAQVRVPLPWTPVPITGQTFAVLISGVLLGSCWGGISQVVYVGLGIAGVPWFNNWQGGISHLAGPTGGYLIGFILAAFLIGYLTDKYVYTRKFHSLLGLMLVINFGLIYVPGLVQLDLWLNLIKGRAVSFSQILAMGFSPFIMGDMVKIIFVAAIAWGVTPKQALNREK